MIAILQSQMNSMISGAVLMREASRTSRRWQTYATRCAFSGILMGCTVFAIYGGTLLSAQDPATMAWLGRGMFIGLAVMQTLLAFVFAPLMVSRAIIEERVDGTVELLILTRLTPNAVLGAKVMSRILVLLTVILGALPVLALVMSLGGVSPIEILAVTTHTLTAVLVLGAMGGFFAVFTRSPLVATAATLIYTVPTFVFLPGMYVALTGLPSSAAHVSPLFGTASQDWWSLLPIITFAPVMALLIRVGASAFQLRVSGARLRRFFTGDMWHTKWFWATLAGVVLYAFSLLPMASITSWYYAAAPAVAGTTWYHTALQGLSVGGIWIWMVALIYVGTWMYLRVAMDMVMVVDATMSPSGGYKNQRRGPPSIRGNPIVWREVRPHAWRSTLPGLVAWLLSLIIVFQMGIWIVPGGLLAIGAVNAITALMLTVWMATGTIERERHDGTLELLLQTTLSSWRIVTGKALGVLAPSMAMLAISFPMIIIALPYMQLVIDNSKVSEIFLRSILICLWLIPFQWMLLAVTMVVAVRMKNAKTAYAVNMTIATLLVAVPPLIEILFNRFPLAVLPARLIMPVLSADAQLWEIALSGTVYGMVALVLLTVLTVNLRKWGLRHG